MRGLVLVLLGMWSMLSAAAEVSLCFNYGCLNEARVRFTDTLLDEIGRDVGTARDAADERRRIALAIGRLYYEADRQAPIAADRAGNYLDGGVYGKMDCIDHATSTTRLLELLQSRGVFRFHRVVPKMRRTRLLILQHFSAALEELPSSDPPQEGVGPRYVVDSWFVEQGHPAVVMPLDAWLSGEGPDVP